MAHQRGRRVPKLLSLDLSSEVGWALFTGKGPPTFGTERFNKYRDLSYRAAAFQQWLDDHYLRHHWDAISWERPVLMNTDTPDSVAVLYGMPFIALAFAGKHKMRWETVTVQEVKQAVCGELWKDNGVDGRRKMMDKDDMVRCAREIWDWPVNTHHEADAIGVGLIAYEAIFP